VTLALALGGDSLADVAVLRSKPGLFGAVAADPTVSRTITALAAYAPDHDTSASDTPVDLAATLVTTHSDKETSMASCGSSPDTGRFGQLVGERSLHWK